MAALTKATFEQTAAIIRARLERTKYDYDADSRETASTVLYGIALDFSGMFSASNGRFDHGRFMAACGF